MISIKLEKSHIDRMSKIALLNEEEKKLLGALHSRKQYKKKSVIDQQGTISKAVYYLNKGILSMEYQHGSKVFVRDFIFKDSPALVYPSFY